MNLPFTVEQFFEVFRTYNHAVWPAQVVTCVLGIAAVVLGTRRRRSLDRVAWAILAAFWLWTGIAYHLLHFSRINPAAYVFGGLFIVQGLLLLALGEIKPRLAFQPARGVWPIIGAALIFYAMVIYPLLGLLLGHRAEELPWFGVTPCPTTIFTFGMLLWATGRGRFIVFIIPLLWSIIGGSATIHLRVPQDCGLIAAGLIGLINLLATRRRSLLTGEGQSGH